MSRFMIYLIGFLMVSGVSFSQEQGIAPITDYKLEGKGQETLVIIPCFSCRWKSFEPFIERNKDKYQILAVTLPGHGGTGFPDIPINTEGTPWHNNAWRAVAQLMEQNEITNAVLVTHSFGTDIGVHLASERPDLFKAFIALDSNPTDPVEQGEKTMAERLITANEIRVKFMEPLKDPDEWINFNAARGIKDLERRIVYHGMFVATEKEVMFQYWRENMLQDINPAFSGLQMPYFDIQTISSGQKDQEKARLAHLENINSVGAPSVYEPIFIYKSSHFVMEERPKVLDRMIKEIVLQGTKPEDWQPSDEEK